MSYKIVTSKPIMLKDGTIIPEGEDVSQYFSTKVEKKKEDSDVKQDQKKDIIARYVSKSKELVERKG